MKSFLRLIPILALISTMSAPAEEVATAHKRLCLTKHGTDLVYPGKTKFQIVGYDSNTDTYEIQSPELPGEGTSYITFQTFMKLVKEAKGMESVLKKKPDDVVDGVFEATADLPTLFPKEREKREGCRKVR